MGQVRVGTASWTDRTLIASGWYPPEADTPEKRLRYYARQFPLVEVDVTYYALPAEQTAALWAVRTPAAFTFNVKAFSLFTQHPTKVTALPADLRPAAEKTGKDRIYLHDVGPAVAGQVWERFLAGLDPLRHAGKLGAILLQFPPWLPISRAGKDCIVACAERAAPDRVCIEFRNRTWMTPDNQDETLSFLAAHRLPYVCADMPQGHRDSIPPVLAATAPELAVVRLHGHSSKWDSRDIHERFGCRYTDAELAEWAPKVRAPWPATPNKPTCCSTTATATTPRPTPGSSPPCSTPDRPRKGPAKPPPGARTRGSPPDPGRFTTATPAWGPGRRAGDPPAGGSASRR
jgi:uncharacterized protein YecE (DUF72 family)